MALKKLNYCEAINSPYIIYVWRIFMVIYTSLIDKGIISKGMKFIYLSEEKDFINAWSLDLQFHFKISKTSLSSNFKKNIVNI